MLSRTAELWAAQDRHEGDRRRLFRAVGSAVGAATVLYPGSFVDIAPSFVWGDVTYVDVDRRAERFFADVEGVTEVVADHGGPADPTITFHRADYTEELRLGREGFGLLVSLYAGPVSEHCGHVLRLGGTLLVNPSHGDAALASLDARFELDGVVHSRSGDYSVSREDLDTYLVPKSGTPVSVEKIRQTCRGVAYTRSPFAYLFRRTR